jgi:hypothetical protein
LIGIVFSFKNKRPEKKDYIENIEPIGYALSPPCNPPSVQFMQITLDFFQEPRGTEPFQQTVGELWRM